ncbi:MAG: cyclopropane-fatty-acyl-phospholipid synthase family protein [Steroidobacteraceae bacterium]
MKLSMSLLEKSLLPDAVIRYGIRRLLAQRLIEEDKSDPESQQAHLMHLVEQLRASPVAVNTATANEQHYEVPAVFYQRVLGKYLKYSSCYFQPGVTSLDDAEAEMLRLTVERAQLTNGDYILELGCGWGSLSLYMAEKFPDSRITGVSNSNSQREFIMAQAAARGLTNLKIITCDVNVLQFPAEQRFDRVVSVEMFEHMRNYQTLLKRIAAWTRPGGTFFVHIFTHREYAYPFEVRDDSDWMAKYFFTGGIMPSDDLLLYFQDDLQLRQHWQVNGQHYQKTAEAWLANMDAHSEQIIPVFAQTYGTANATKWWNYWRVFFMSCAELWGYNQGREWLVSHYLFERPH